MGHTKRLIQFPRDFFSESTRSIASPMCVSGAAGAAALSRLAARLEEPVPLMWSAARTFLSRSTPGELEAALEDPARDEDDDARPRVPPGLFPALLAAALGRGDGRRPRDLLSVRLLVKHWPEETLRLAEVLQAGRDMTSGMPPPIPRDEEETEKEATPALFLLWAYLDGLGHSRRPLLRTLDLRDGAGSSDSSPSFVTDSAFALGHHVDLLASRRAVEQLKSEKSLSLHFGIHLILVALLVAVPDSQLQGSELKSR